MWNKGAMITFNNELRGDVMKNKTFGMGNIKADYNNLAGVYGAMGEKQRGIELDHLEKTNHSKLANALKMTAQPQSDNPQSFLPSQPQ